MRFLISSAVFLLCAFPAWAASIDGKLEICRYPGISDINDHKAIRLPKGLMFTQDIPGSDEIGTEFKTLESGEMGPKPACVIVRAEIMSRPSYAPKLSNKSRLLAQFSSPRGEFQTRIVEGFR